MSIVLNENEWAEKALRDLSTGKKPFETYRRVARYYIDNGYTPKETRRRLDIFALRCGANTSSVRTSSLLDDAVKYAAKHPAVKIEDIPVTSAELATIDALDGKQIRRLAFTLLCLAVYGLSIDAKRDGWVNNSDNEIMALANINTSVQRQCAMYAALQHKGLIQYSKRVDNTSVKVLFIADGEVEMRITDFRNLGYQYLRRCGEPYFECANCGITTKIRNRQGGRPQKYCPECAMLIRTQQNVNAVMRQRKCPN